jgi:ABC-type sulfate/molybdate transport systems ATPase subunit
MLKAQFGKKLPGFELKIDIALKNGILVVAGPSGAGKTTLLQCIGGLQKPSWGEILIGSRLIFSVEQGINVPVRNRRIGYVFQDYALFPHMTVAKNVVYGMSKEHNRRTKIRIGDVNYDEFPKTILLSVLEDEFVERAIATIIENAQTGSMGDGKIFVTEIEEVYTVSTGTRGL